MDYENWQVLKLIGEGAYAKVYLVRHHKRIGPLGSILQGHQFAGTQMPPEIMTSFDPEYSQKKTADPMAGDLPDPISGATGDYC
mmetsp:Transcript_27852/g.42136  ORF Transcript_27852/g.42136 Transcript_27852/m.42136 type:complete len:84 (+) Transcript_27852:287-538(+)